jgi:Ca-activated chloride channel family protein
MKTWIKALGLSALLASAISAAPAFAQDEDESEVGSLVVTAQLRQGGAQDIDYFRNETEALRIPLPTSLTPEGLMGDYNLVLGPQPPCPQLFCITGEAMAADLMLRPGDKVFVGLGFASNIDADAWKRPALNLVAVVDKSGSMDGQPLDLVRKSLKEIVRQMKPGDQITIVLYGSTSHRYLQPTAITRSNIPDVLRKIDGIESEGSTNMEEGLEVGYAAAFETAPAFKGVTRLMLFTDEQPNVGATDAQSFIGMAKAASERGIGLTTVGVGVQFDSALATKVSSTRGGNLYFMASEADVNTVFAAKLDYMVTEVAHDIRMAIAPAKGYRITAVYGVPGEALAWRGEDAVEFTLPTVFLSKEGGGIFVTLAPAEPNLPAPRGGQSLVKVDLTYVGAADRKAGAHSLAIADISAKPGRDLVLGQALIDEYLGLKEGVTLYHAGDDEGAYRVLRDLAVRLDRVDDPRLKAERELVGRLHAQTAFMSGHSAEPPKTVAFMGLYGDWRVVGVRGDIDLKPGDKMAFSAENEAVVTRIVAGVEKADDPEPYKADNRRLTLPDSEAVFRYQIDAGGDLTLRHRETGVAVRLKREGAVPIAAIRELSSADEDY